MAHATQVINDVTYPVYNSPATLLEILDLVGNVGYTVYRGHYASEYEACSVVPLANVIQLLLAVFAPDSQTTISIESFHVGNPGVPHPTARILLLHNADCLPESVREFFSSEDDLWVGPTGFPSEDQVEILP